MVWRGLTDPAELARMGPRWRSQLFMVAGKTGSVPLPRGSAQPSPVPASDAETIAAVRTIDRIPMPDEVTAAYHTHKHHHELPPTEQFNAASPRAGVSNEFDAYMKAAMETVHNPATTTVAATQDGTGRVITFTRQVRWPDGRTATSRALVLVSFDGRVTLLTYIPGA
jgi:hypothetical protein